MKRLLTAAIAVALLATCLTPAWANHRHPPRAILKAPHTWQKGVLGTYCWNYVDKGSDEGVGFCADSLHSFPEPDSSSAGEPAKIRLWAKRLPDEASVSFWRELDENGQPVGEPETFVSVVKPHRKDGQIVAYDVRFVFPETPGHLYMTAFVRWSGLRYDDGRADGDASYDFHVVTE